MKKRCLALLLLSAVTGALCAQTPADAPLFIVDSAVVENTGDLDPNSIQSITILKGPDAVSAAAAYGKSGTGGVVLIETKDPKKYLPVQQFLLLRHIEVTQHTLVMLDNKLVRHPGSDQLDTSDVARVVLEELDNLTYLDPVYKHLQLVRIYSRKSRGGIVNNSNTPALSGKKAMVPPDRYTGFKNLQRIRAAGSAPGTADHPTKKSRSYE